MTPHKFSVGDRVRLRGTDRKGKVFKIDECALNEICVHWDNSPPSWLMAETLKRLKPKLQAEVKAREWWVNPRDAGGPVERHSGVFYTGVTRDNYSYNKWVHVREVIPNSITITREQLSDAWTPLCYGDFNQLCKALGFEDSK